MNHQNRLVFQFDCLIENSHIYLQHAKYGITLIVLFVRSTTAAIRFSVLPEASSCMLYTHTQHHHMHWTHMVLLIMIHFSAPPFMHDDGEFIFVFIIRKFTVLCFWYGALRMRTLSLSSCLFVVFRWYRNKWKMPGANCAQFYCVRWRWSPL